MICPRAQFSISHGTDPWETTDCAHRIFEASEIWIFLIKGYAEELPLNDIRRLVDAQDSDLFDVLSYILFINQPKTSDLRPNFPPV